MKRLLALPLVTLLSTASCSQLSQVTDLIAPYTPKMSFNTLALNSIDFSKIDVDFKFNVANPNPISVKLDQFSYALGLEGVELLKGSNTDGFALKSKGDTELSIPVSLKFADIFSLVKNVEGKDQLGFSLAGDFGFNTPVGMATVPFKEEGKFPVVHAPSISIKDAKVKDFNLMKNKATLALDLGISNTKGGSAIGLAGLNYDISLGGKNVGGGSMESVASVAGGAEQTLSIPVDLKIKELGTTIIALAQGKSAADVGIKGVVQVSTPFGNIPLDISEVGNFLLK